MLIYEKNAPKETVFTTVLNLEKKSNIVRRAVNRNMAATINMGKVMLSETQRSQASSLYQNPY